MGSSFAQRSAGILFIYIAIVSIIISAIAMSQAEMINQGLTIDAKHQLISQVEGYQFSTQNSANITEDIDVGTGLFNIKTNWVSEFWKLVKFDFRTGSDNLFINTSQNIIRFITIWLPLTLFLIYLILSFWL